MSAPLGTCSPHNCARKIDRSVVARDRTAASAARPVAEPRPVAWKHLPTELLAFSVSRAMTTLIAILGNHPHGWNSTRDAELRREKLCAIASDSERFFLVVVGIFKNEADILPEWLEHHLWQGVEHFFLIDNNSTDDWQRAVAPFAKHVSVRSDPVPYQQERLVTSWLTIIQARARWAMQIDVDEFVYASPRAGFENIPAYIRHVEQTDCLSTYLLLHWQVFGSSGHTVQPPSVRINFTRAAATPHSLTKYIARTNALRSFWVHHPLMWHSMSKQWLMPDQQPPLVLNHYHIQSRERFAAVKMTRGDVKSSVYEGQKKSMSYFDNTDRECNQVDNLELRDLVLCYRYRGGLHVNMSNVNVTYSCASTR